MKILFVVNPIAGGMNRGGALDELKQRIADLSVDGIFYLTTGEDDDAKIARIIDKQGPDCVVAAGGDGTVRQVAELLMPTQIAMGILPFGSANGLATALSVPTGIDEALTAILNAPAARPLDVLQFDGSRICVHLADIGVNALLVKKYAEAGQRGLLGYAKHLLSAIQETPVYEILVKTATETFEKQGVMMAFANAHKYGTGVQISEGSVSDGQFEVVNVEAVTLEEAIKAGLTILNVFVDPDMFSDVITCREARIEINQKAHFQIDGEYIGMTDHLLVEILPGALRLLL